MLAESSGRGPIKRAIGASDDRACDRRRRLTALAILLRQGIFIESERQSARGFSIRPVPKFNGQLKERLKRTRVKEVVKWFVRHGNQNKLGCRTWPSS